MSNSNAGTANIYYGAKLSGQLHLLHENIHLPESAEFKVEISCDDKVLFENILTVNYHHRLDLPIRLDLL